jgi:hypothetical protein
MRKPMSEPNWQVLKTTEVPAKPKQGYWTRAVDYVNPSQRLRFVVEEPATTPPSQSSQAGATAAAATSAPAPPLTGSSAPPATSTLASAPGTPPPAASAPAIPTPLSAPKWSYAPERKCTADGDPRAPLNPATCLFTDAPPGALIAKIGGSTAGKTDGTKLFVVGSYCVVELDDKTKGPLYLAMNNDPMSSLERSGSLQVTISQSA